VPKVALAYSGSLDTAICVHYLRHVRGMKVYTFSANVGQPEYLEPLAEQAVDLGAAAANLADLRDKFSRDYIFPCIRANAVYEQGYYLFSALARPLIVEELLQVATDEDCEFIAHGSRGLGNDRVRLENIVRSLAPDMKVLTPLIDLNLRSPADDLGYAKEHRIPVLSEKLALWNVEQNLWGNNMQVGVPDTWQDPPRDTYILTVPASEAPAKPTVLEIGFEKGVPVSVDGEALPPVKLIEVLNKMAGRCAVGRFDVVENRISGRKTRELYEAPAAAVLHAAHQALQAITLEKESLHFQEPLSRKFAELVYEGNWFGPLREGLDRFFARLNERVTGDVRVSLLRGAVTILGRRSPHSLFEPR
jgi:argininosuccinate synthase